MIVNKYARKPFYVEAVQVTAENIEEVAKWCGGQLIKGTEADPHAYVKVKVKRPLSARQTKAFHNDWVLKAGTGYKVYTSAAFDKSFDTLTVREQNMPAVLNEIEQALESIEEGLDSIVGDKA